jgi:hypothetical protein
LKTWAITPRLSASFFQLKLALSCGLVLSGRVACTRPTLAKAPKRSRCSSGLRVVTLMVPARPPSAILACEVL